MKPRTSDFTLSVLASTLRGWRGSATGKHRQQPKQLLQLFDRENEPQCRLVRETLTELDLDALIYPIPMGATRYMDKLAELTHPESAEVPFLYDPNDEQTLSGARTIINYLFATYGRRSVPAMLRANAINTFTAKLSSWLRSDHGTQSIPSQNADKPLELYSFESSPYSRLVREKLCELEIAYILRNIGKQQWADVGPAKPRLTTRRYKPVPGTKRAAFFEQHGNVQVPYLIDPNTGKDLFESRDILDYLEQTYQTKTQAA